MTLTKERRRSADDDDRPRHIHLNIHHPIQPAYLSRRVCGVRVRYACGISVRTTPLPEKGKPGAIFRPPCPWFMFWLLLFSRAAAGFSCFFIFLITDT